MRLIYFVVFFFSIQTFVTGQNLYDNTSIKWYSESFNDGIIVQNSFPKGGPYTGPTKRNFNYSYVVFFTRVMNQTEASLALTINFTADSIPIPDSPDTFVKLYLPADTMTLDKESQFSYGVTELESLDRPSMFQRTINPGKECMFYVVAIYYQTSATAQYQGRGGNRAELVIKGQDLFYRMPPRLTPFIADKLFLRNKLIRKTIDTGLKLSDSLVRNAKRSFHRFVTLHDVRMTIFTYKPLQQNGTCEM